MLRRVNQTALGALGALAALGAPGHHDVTGC